MHSFLDFANPQVHTLLWVQVIGMPIAFLVRAVVLAVRAAREAPENRPKHTIRAVSNVFFAASCWTFALSHLLAIACFASGIGLSIWAFVIARELAIRTRPLAPAPKVISAARSNRSMRLARMRRNPN